jgi:hypothetical protein
MGVKIKLYLGGPCTERASKEIESDAIKHDISLEQSLLDWFSHYFYASLKYRDNDRNFYDIMLGLQLDFIYGDRVKPGPLSPKVTSEFYVQAGYKYPVVILHGEMATVKEGGDSFPINDDIINFLGKELEDLMELEYIRFERLGSSFKF